MRVEPPKSIQRMRRKLRRRFRKHREAIFFCGLFVFAALSCIWLIFRLGS